MTNEEEKILDEENDITLEEAAEEAEDLQEETQDEGRAIEIPIERREDVNLEDVLECPVLRGGLRGAADPNMIQKHIDNFLAMLCGETPVDSNVRTSAEYWLKRLATGEGAGSTKKIYRHSITISQNAGDTYNYAITFSIFSNSTTPYTWDTLLTAQAEFPRIAPMVGYIQDIADDGKIYAVVWTYLNNSNKQQFVGRDLSSFVTISALTLDNLPNPASFADYVQSLN